MFSMEFEKISTDRLRVLLSAKDTETLGIARDRLTLNSYALGESLFKVLEEASRQTGISIKGKRFLVEIYPYDNNGYTLYFTVLHTKHFKSMRYRFSPVYLSPYLFYFSNFSVLQAASHAVFCHMSHRILRSALYRLGKYYVLAVVPLDTPQNRAIRLLAEFASCFGKGRLMELIVSEHCISLCQNAAIDRLAQGDIF